jgi:DNA-binding response OmpR family regulator
VVARILVIDDDVAMTEMLRELLEPKAFEVRTAQTGEQGIAFARDDKLDVIILDLFMPGMDGWQVCKLIREFSRVPILVLSAMSNPSMVARALDEGADDYLSKPVPSGVLVAHLNNLIRRGRAEREAGASKGEYISC